ncbi:terminase large subunit domain-containing protein [Caballeronia sp. RCC_10]|uniref:terminase large subunit domain-containing protein n=1 Tax=Caballeronia sp. RCC_10 TaxID=3239227 RepID=UPI003525B8EA
MPNSKPSSPEDGSRISSADCVDAISVEKAAAELLTRRRARSDIVEYANAIEVPGRPVGGDAGDDADADDCDEFEPIARPLAAHHRLIMERVEATSRTPHGRLMIFTPPGSGKSTYASVVFPSWYLGAAPERRLILASYGDALASRMGRRTRSIVRQARWQRMWNTELAADSHAAHAFALNNGSEYLACGILSGVTGNRCGGLLIDDPVRGREQADSEVVRDKVFDAYEDDLKTRLVPGGWIVLIQTRWHEDDLAGRILPEGWHGESGRIACRDGNTWDVLCLQARCETDTDPLGREKGDYLWPEWFDRKHWAQYESNPRTWASLYQQMPAPPEGDLFKPERIAVVDIVPTTYIEWVRGWDLASVEGDGDWTAGAKLGRLIDGKRRDRKSCAVRGAGNV